MFLLVTIATAVIVNDEKLKNARATICDLIRDFKIRQKVMEMEHLIFTVLHIQV